MPSPGRRWLLRRAPYSEVFFESLIVLNCSLKLTFLNSDMYDFLFFPRFLLIFAACLLSLLGKGLALASPFASYEGEQLEHEIQASKYREANTSKYRQANTG